MADNKLSEMISTSLDSIRAIADSSTVIGDPIPTNNGTVIIPVSKITLGFASGGLDYQPKRGDGDAKSAQGAKPAAPCFGGGGGTGVSVNPVCCLVSSKDGNVSMLNVNSPAAVSPAVGAIDSASSFAEKLPDVIERFKNIFAKKKTEDGLDDETLSKELEELDSLDK